MPVGYLVLSLRVAVKERWEGNALVQRLENLEKLDETCLLALNTMLQEKTM